MKKAKISKAKNTVRKENWFWRCFSFCVKWYFKIKYRIRRPETKLVQGLMPVGFMQQQVLARAYSALKYSGKSSRQVRKIIAKKFNIKVIPETPVHDQKKVIYKKGVSMP